jgi:catechol 2,3-dioxygenase-like lactoylglutathione lyase family enzyme
MAATIQTAIPILPTPDVAASLAWWTNICGFTETFRHGTPPEYAGVERQGARLHLNLFRDPALAKTVGEQTMVRFLVEDVADLYAEYQQRGGVVHPNGPLQKKPWGTTEFAAIDPGGVCVTFQE